MDVSIAQKRECRRNWLNKLEFFDAYCQLLTPLNALPKPPFDSPLSLLAEMDRNGVARALVHHGNAPDVGAVAANAELAAAIRPFADRLTGIWSILPSQCDEIPAPDKLFVSMVRNNIGALTLLPLAHRWQPCRLTIGKLMDAAAERQVPVILPSRMMNGWSGIYAFMKEFPRATVIISQLGLWGSDRNVRPLFENYAGVHLELGEYWVPEGIRDLADRYGAERLLYGSDIPSYGFGSTMFLLINSQLPRNDISAIASGNLKRLLAWT